MPGIEGKEKDHICAFKSKEDLEPQLRTFLKPGGEGNLHIWHESLEKAFRIFSGCFTVISAGGGLVRNRKGEILVIFRKGKWDLPKGKSEPGESKEETALREVAEECHLEDLSIEKPLLLTYHIYFLGEEPVLKENHWYLMKYPGTGDPVPATGEGITRTVWISAGQFEKLEGEVFPSIRDVIDYYLN